MDISLLKPVDAWFWVFSISVLVAILATYLSIRNHPELRWLLILRGISLIIALFLLLQPRFTWTENKAIELEWNFYVDNSVSIGYHPALSLQTIKSELSNNEPTLYQSMFFPATISLVMPFTSDASSEIGIPGSLNDS